MAWASTVRFMACWVKTRPAMASMTAFLGRESRFPTSKVRPWRASSRSVLFSRTAFWTISALFLISWSSESPSSYSKSSLIAEF